MPGKSKTRKKSGGPKILLIQGANMVHLGKREPEIYGTTTAKELDAMLMQHARDNGYALEIFYTNVEGEAIDRIYRALDEGVQGLVMNPAGFNYAGHALRDCVKGSGLPYVEVHMSNVEARGIECVVAKVARGVVFGLGTYSYVLGLEGMLHVLGHRGASS